MICGATALAGVAAGLWVSVAPAAAGELAAGFASPPAQARCWVYWWWLDGNASVEGITRDLEEMKRQGIGGVLVFDAGEGGPDAPDGPVFMSPAWRELFKHALREADRLGIEVGVNLCSGWNAGGTWVTPEHAAKTAVWSLAEVEGGAAVDQVLPSPEIRGDHYREVAVLAFPAGRRPADSPPLKHLPFKAARTWLSMPPWRLYEEEPEVPGDQDCRRDEVVDLTDRVDAAGRLRWEAPPGRWRVMRFGYTLLGALTKCVSPGSQGPEIDFLSAAAMDLHWAETGARLVADAGPLAGRTLRYVHDDSYEVCGPDNSQINWTPAFPAEFARRRGYDLRPFLPVLAGFIIDDRSTSNRFLWDYRRTIGDLFADGHYRRMRELAARHGLGTHPESGGPFWPYIDGLELAGINDIPMGEFWKRVPEAPDGRIMWADNYPICDTVRQAASAAHIQGRRVCQAEAYTSMGPNWEEDFFDLKDIGDQAFCAGLTRNVLCFYVHQPRLDIRPGYQWEAAGTHFDRNVTWWDQAGAWIGYLNRCQHLLQQGLFVADLCYFLGEGVPNFVPGKAFLRPELPAGHDFDAITAEVLLDRLSVRDGRLVLPDGMSYRLLVLGPEPVMTPRCLQKVRELVEAGARVLGPRTRHSPGLAGQPQADRQVQALAAALWGEAEEPPPGRRDVGQGRVYTGMSPAEVLRAEGVPPDVEFHTVTAAPRIDFIHRRCDEADVYFLANLRNGGDVVECVFRATAGQPEIWDAVSGRRWRAEAFRVQDGRTSMTLAFAPRQSWFVVFPRGGEPAKDGYRNVPAVVDAGGLEGPWTVRFDPAWGGPESVVFEELTDWTRRPEDGIRFYSGRAVYERTFDLPEALRGRKGTLWLDLGLVRNVAEVRLNGRDLGVVWTAPWRVDITPAVRPEGNRLEIAVVNLWPNRLIGDAGLPPEQRRTHTNVKKFDKPDLPLLPSGLLGPVRFATGD